MLSRRSMLKWVAGIATGFGLGGAAKCANAAELREAPLSNPLPDFPKFNLADKLIAGQYESIGYGVFYFTLEEAVIVSFPNDEHAISMFVEAGEAFSLYLGPYDATDSEGFHYTETPWSHIEMLPWDVDFFGFAPEGPNPVRYQRSDGLMAERHPTSESERTWTFSSRPRPITAMKPDSSST
jgi:hypothetical protein